MPKEDKQQHYQQKGTKSNNNSPGENYINYILKIYLII
jgi:hypothetical protein